MEILSNIGLYIFIVSIVFNLKILFDVLISIYGEVPTELKISKPNKLFLLLSVAYFITYIISLIIN